MATVYSNEVAVGQWNRIRIACDYSGTSATLTIQFRRTSSRSDTWTGASSTLTLGNTTLSANYSYTGTVSTSWVNLRPAIPGYTISLSGGEYSWVFNDSGVLGCQGTIIIPSQTTAPNKPIVCATPNSDTSIVVNYGTTDFNDSTGSISLYADTTASFTPDASNLIDTKTTTGSTIFNHTGLTNGATYYYKAIATNSLYSSTSDEVSAVADYDYPPKLYGEAGDVTTKVDKLYGPVNDVSTRITKLYGSVNGQTKRIF